MARQLCLMELTEMAQKQSSKIWICKQINDLQITCACCFPAVMHKDAVFFLLWAQTTYKSSDSDQTWVSLLSWLITSRWIHPVQQIQNLQMVWASKKAGRSVLFLSAALIEGKKKQITGPAGKSNVYRHLVGWMGSRRKRQGLNQGMYLQLFSLRWVYPWQYLVRNEDGTQRANFALNLHLTSWHEKWFVFTRFRLKGSVHYRCGRFKYSIRNSETCTLNPVRWWICAHL